MHQSLDFFTRNFPNVRTVNITNTFGLDSLVHYIRLSQKKSGWLFIAEKTPESAVLLQPEHPSFRYNPANLVVIRNGHELYYSSKEKPLTVEAWAAFFRNGTKCVKCQHWAISNALCPQCGMSLCLACLRKSCDSSTCMKCKQDLSKFLPKPVCLALDPALQLGGYDPASTAKIKRGLKSLTVLAADVYRYLSISKPSVFSINADQIANYNKYPTPDDNFWRDKIFPLKTVDIVTYVRVADAVGEELLPSKTQWLRTKDLLDTNRGSSFAVIMRHNTKKKAQLFWFRVIRKDYLIMGCASDCYTCQKQAGTQMCPGCSVVRFCSEACRVAMRERHQKECASFRRKPKPDGNSLMVF